MKARTVVTVVVCGLFLVVGMSAHATVWFVPADFATIQDAMDSADVVDGDKIIVSAGEHVGATVTKAVTITGAGGAIITAGPLHGSGLVQGFRLVDDSDGATISHLKFTVDLAIMNGTAVDDVTINQCIFINAIQAISNWRGSGWEISHNDIIDLRTSCGGGIGILVADHAGGTVSDNVISHNKISGTLHVSPDDCGGYAGTGIALFADFRWTRIGTQSISLNRVLKNKVSLESDNIGLVDVWAFELTDTRDDVNADPYPVIHGNSVGFNDFRGTVNQISLTPEDLINNNEISRNFGENRGHGSFPQLLFGPSN